MRMYSLGMRLMLVGNYGTGNLGDEALKEYFLKSFSEYNWNIVYAKPFQNNEYCRFPAGVRSFFGFKWIKTLRVLLKCDVMVFGGGSLFTDNESVSACFIWGIHAFFAWFFRVPIVLAFQGIGPLKTFRAKTVTRFVLKKSAFISVRDKFSMECAQSLVLNKKIIQTFDPIFSLIKEQEYDLCSQKVFIAIPRNNSNAIFIKNFLNLIKSDRWEEVHVLSLQPDNKEEMIFCESLKKFTDVDMKIIHVRSLDDLISSVSKGSFVLSQRYHAALAALALGRELLVIPQGDDDKLASIQSIIDDVPLHIRRDTLLKQVAEGEEKLRRYLNDNLYE